jgi:hypothetical protein
MDYIGLDVHKKTLSYCAKDASGQVHQGFLRGNIEATLGTYQDRDLGRPPPRAGWPWRAGRVTIDIRLVLIRVSTTTLSQIGTSV